MARHTPNTRYQNFFEESVIREDRARLKFWMNRQQSAGGQNRRFRGSSAKLLTGLPTINPQQFAKQIKNKEIEDHKKLIAECRKGREIHEMRKVEPEEKEELYEGFTKEEKGRYAYLNTRKRTIPEVKYTRPICSSWVYGWKLDDSIKATKPTHARTKIVRDTFYTTNGVPDLPETTMVPSPMRRCMTALW